jgi:transposase-like protein
MGGTKTGSGPFDIGQSTGKRLPDDQKSGARIVDGKIWTKKPGGFKNIMSSVRKHYATDLKVKIVLEMLREEKTVTQLASEYKIHYSQLLKWKKQVLEGLPHLFSDTRTEALKTTHEKEMLALYQEIGQLTTQLAWLKKKSGMN